MSRADVPPNPDEMVNIIDGQEREFVRVENDHYMMAIPSLAIELDVEGLRRERGHWLAQLTVICRLPGARTYDGVLSICDFNLSSLSARKGMVGYLAEKSRGVSDIDWKGLLEELCQRIINAERIGEPAVDLSTMEAPPDDATIDIDGLPLLLQHPVILFGDGGSLKSYLALYIAGRLAQAGHRVLFADWELEASAHHRRLRRLFDVDLTPVYYARCDRPLVVEADRLRRLVRQHQITYAVLDSVAYGCDGPPEAAEVAGRYFRALRPLGVGSLLTAHTNRSEKNDEKPFGSAFWHNSARATWFVKAEEPSLDGDVIPVGLFNKKANLGRLRPAVAFEVSFSETRTAIRRTSITESPDLAQRLPLWQRMRHVLASGPLAIPEMAERLGAAPDDVRKNANRKTRVFTRLSDGTRIGLVEWRPYR